MCRIVNSCYNKKYRDGCIFQSSSFFIFADLEKIRNFCYDAFAVKSFVGKEGKIDGTG